MKPAKEHHFGWASYDVYLQEQTGYQGTLLIKILTPFFLAVNIPHFLLYSKLWILETSNYLSICPAGLMLQVEMYEKQLIVKEVLKQPAQL